MKWVTYHRLLIIPSGVRGIIYLFFLFGFCVRAQEVDSYEEFERSQQTCLIGVADYYPVQKLTYNGHELDYHGTYGDVFFYLMKQDLDQYKN